MKTFIIYGKAGCGKTTKLIEYVKTLSANERDFVVLAPTNAAVDNIRSKCPNIESRLFRTIHSFFRIDYVNDTILGPIHTPEYILIDEFSLIDKQLFKRIYDILSTSFLCQELRIYGDPLQLPPINAVKSISYNKLKDILNIIPNSHIDVIKHINSTIFNMKKLSGASFQLLDVNYRSNTAVRDILTVVLNNQIERFDILKFIDRWQIPKLITEGYTYIAPTYKQLQEVYDEMYDGVSDKALITINQNIPVTVGYNRLYIYPGMEVFTTITDKELGVYNGEVLTIKTIYTNIIECIRQNGEIISINKIPYITETPNGQKVINPYFPISPTWLLTVHKSQGKTIKNVIVCIDHTFSVSMLYTAMTRASENLLFYTAKSDKHKAITEASKYKEFRQLHKLITSFQSKTG